MSYEIFKSPGKRNNEDLDYSKSPSSEINNDNSAEEVKIDFSDISNQYDFSDLKISDSNDYNRSISDSNTLLNEITSKLFQSEGNFSTLIIFLQQVRTIIFDTETEPPEDEAISTTCSSIVDKINQILEEHLQMKEALKKFAFKCDENIIDENNQQLLSSGAEEDQISHYTKVIQQAMNKLEKTENTNSSQNNQDNPNTIINKGNDIQLEPNNSSNPEPHAKENQINELEQKFKQKEERMARIIKDLRKKLEKLKSQKYTTDAGIKRVERQLLNGKEPEKNQEDNKRYDNMVDQIKELQSKNRKFSKIFSFFQSNFANNENNDKSDNDNPIQILKVFKDLRNENHHLQKENQRLDHLIKNSEVIKPKNVGDDRQVEEMNSKMASMERDLEEYKAALSSIEDILLVDDPNSSTQKMKETLHQKVAHMSEKINAMAKSNKDSAEKNEILTNNMNQIRTALNVQNDNNDEILPAINNLKRKIEVLEAKQSKLVSQAKQIITQSKQLKADLSNAKNNETVLQKKIDDEKKIINTLKEANNKLKEKYETKKSHILLLNKKVQLLSATLETIKKEFIKIITNAEDKEAIKSISSVPKAFIIFLSKYNKQVSLKLHGRFHPIISNFDSQIHNLNTQITSVTSKYQNLIMKNSKEKDKMVSEINHLKEVADGYVKTLKILFPPFLNIKTVSKTKEIHNHLEKLRAITNSLFVLIPRIRRPSQKESLYCLILALRAVLMSSKLSNNLPVVFTSDISVSSIKLNESQIRNGILFQYEAKNKELSQMLYQSIRYDDVVEIISDMTKTRPKIINEESVIEMFNMLRDKLNKAELDREKLSDYTSMVKILLDGLSKKVPSNLNMIVNQLTSFNL